jgi:hypothetical protein
MFNYDRCDNTVMLVGGCCHTEGTRSVDIHREGDYYVWSDLQKRLLCGIDSTCLDACVEEANRRKAYGVFGSPTFGFREDNLDFLAKLSRIGSIWFWDVDLQDISGLYELSELRSFGVHTKRPAVDFSRLMKLDSVVWFYNAKDSGVSTLRKVSTMSVRHFKPSHKSFKSLELPPGVEELELAFANPLSLSGLPVLPKLKYLQIHRCRNLETIETLPQIAPNLERLLVATSGRVSVAADVLKQLPKLQRAYVNGKLLFGPM